jgi:hypothetical protein
MRIIAIYNGIEYKSKSEPLTLAEVKEVADGLYEVSGEMNKMNFATTDGHMIIPEAILKQCILLVETEECDYNHPDNPTK